MARRRGIAFFRPEVRPGTLTGAQARGAVAIGALAGRLKVREGLPK
jgi:hypothetical protein